MPNVWAMAASIRLERRLPNDVAETVVGWIFRFRAMIAKEDPATRSLAFSASCCAIEDAMC